MAIKTRTQVNHETSPLAKARACAEVVMAMSEDGQPRVASAIDELRLLLGSQWTAMHTLQFLSGKAGLAAINGAAASDDRQRLALARRLAQEALLTAQELGKGSSS